MPLKQFETGNPLGRAKKTWSKIGPAAVAYIALPAPRGLSSGGAAPASAGAGCVQLSIFFKYLYRHNLFHEVIYAQYSCKLKKKYYFFNYLYRRNFFQKVISAQLLVFCMLVF